MLAAALAGATFTRAPLATTANLAPWIVFAFHFALMSSGPVCSAALLLLGGRLTVRLMGLAFLLVTPVVTLRLVGEHFSLVLPDRILFVSMMLQSTFAVLPICAAFGAIGTILERITPVRFVVCLVAYFWAGYFVSALLFSQMDA